MLLRLLALASKTSGLLRFALPLCLPLFAVLCLAAAPPTAPPPDAAPPDAPDPAARREAELAAIRAEIAQLEGRLKQVRSREAGLEAELEGTEIELKLQESRLREATTARDLAADAVATSVARVAELEQALDAIRADLRRRLGGLYQLGGQGYLRLFLSLEPDHDLLPAIRQLRFLVRRDRDTLDHYATLRDELEERRGTLVAERAAMEDWRNQESERRDHLAALRRRQAGLLRRLSAEREQLAKRAQGLREKARKLERFIDSLVKAGMPALEGTPIGDFRGVLDWPLRGEVKIRFGPQRDPRYRTEVPHNGITLATERGAEVSSVFPGTVLFAAPFEGYGQMVVVHHPGRTFTLYAGLEELRVTKGDVLSLNGVVGLAAEELYFEIRRENQPEDPLEWLR